MNNLKIELKDVNSNKLHDELVVNGIIPSLVESLDNKTWIIIEDNEYDALMVVVTIHNPISLPKAKTKIEILQENQNLIKNALDSLIFGDGL